VSYFRSQKVDQAIALQKEAVALNTAKLGATHPDTLMAKQSLSVMYAQLRKLAETIKVLEEILPIQEKNLGREYPDTKETVGHLGVSYLGEGRIDEANPFLEDAHEFSHKFPPIQWVSPDLLKAYVKSGKSKEAMNVIEALVLRDRNKLGKDSLEFAKKLATYWARVAPLQNHATAEKLLRESLRIRMQVQPESELTYLTEMMLGAHRVAQRRHVEAESHLSSAYKHLTQPGKTLTPRAKLALAKAIPILVMRYTMNRNAAGVEK